MTCRLALSRTLQTSCKWMWPGSGHLPAGPLRLDPTGSADS